MIPVALVAGFVAGVVLGRFRVPRRYRRILFMAALTGAVAAGIVVLIRDNDLSGAGVMAAQVLGSILAAALLGALIWSIVPD